MSEISDAISENAQGPAAASGDSGSITQHKLSEQIEADKYLAGKNATTLRNSLPIRLFKIKAPGTI